MALAYCDHCETLREINCTGKRQDPQKGTTSTWWTIIVHKHPDRQELCGGSGKQV